MNWLLTFLERLFNPIFTGVIQDPRSEEEKQLDPVHEEVAYGLSPVTWQVKDPSQWKHYTPRIQNMRSYDCVAFSSTTGVEADRKTGYPLSAYDIYSQRSNYPNEGMYPFEAVQLIAAHGVLPDSMLPSDNLLESQLNYRVNRTNAMVELAKKFSGGIPTKLTDPTNIDTIASLIAQGISVCLCFRFGENEWQAIPQKKYGGSIDHQVVGVDYAIVNGKKSIIIQDSAFLPTTYYFPKGLRVITEDFLTRCYSATYIKPPSQITISAPQHMFTVDLEYGDQNSEVLFLQQKLQSLGYFPNTVVPTGYFGGITKTAVMQFQNAHQIPTTGFCGSMTRSALNSQ